MCTFFMKSLIHSKLLKIFKAEVKNKLNKRINIVRSDRGGEFYGRYDESGRNFSSFANFLQVYGIIAQYIIPGTPKQNGVIERRNQTLMNIVRSVISISSLPISLWGDDLKTIAHILNHVSSKTTGKTLFGLWTSRKPHLGYMRVWGCPSEAKVYNPRVRKLVPITCHFIGYLKRAK